MKKPPVKMWALLVALAICAAIFTGCGSVGSAASDLGLGAAGGVAGYQLSGKKLGGAAAGAAVGYLDSKVAQSEVQKSQAEAEQRGYDRALNQAVKQQYWIIQNQQRSRETPPETEARLEPVVIPETRINGVLRTAHVEYLRVENP